MHQIYPDAGLMYFLDKMVGADFHFHLFTNAVVPDRNKVLGDFTEAAWTSYAALTVAAADYLISGIVFHRATKIAAPIAFINASGADQNARGYYVTDAGDTILLAASQFDAPPVLKVDGDAWYVTPVIGDFSEFFS